ELRESVLTEFGGWWSKLGPAGSCPLVPARASGAARRALGGESDNRAVFAPLNQSQNVLAPPQERRLYLALIGAAIVNPSDAAAVAGIVVEHGLDDVRLDANVGHAGGNGPADVVKTPRLDRVTKVTFEFLLG